MADSERLTKLQDALRTVSERPSQEDFYTAMNRSATDAPIELAGRITKKDKAVLHALGATEQEMEIAASGMTITVSAMTEEDKQKWGLS